MRILNRGVFDRSCVSVLIILSPLEILTETAIAVNVHPFDGQSNAGPIRGSAPQQTSGNGL